MLSHVTSADRKKLPATNAMSLECLHTTAVRPSTPSPPTPSAERVGVRGDRCRNTAASQLPVAHAAGRIARASLPRNAMDRPNRTPRLATRALPVMRLCAKSAFVAAVHSLAFDELAREVLQ